MKKVLVTGAAGTVGLQVIKFLLSEGKYEITALELKNKNSYKRLKNVRKRINIVYGDINDVNLMDSLVKGHDVVVHLAGVLPPFANVRDDLCKCVDYEGTKNIVNAIANYNPKCWLLYASSTSVYGKHGTEEVNVRTEINIDKLDYYSFYKKEAEDYIKKNIKFYTIFRLAYVLGDPRCESLIYNLKPDTKLEVLSSEDAGYAFVCAIDLFDKVKGKTFNVSGGEKFRTVFKDYLIKIFKMYGLTIRFLSTWMFGEKNYAGGYYGDGDKLEHILHFRSKNLDIYYSSLDKYKYKINRLLPRLFAIPFICKYSINKSKKKRKK